MKNIYILQVVSEVGSFIWAKNSKRQTDESPDVYCTVARTIMMAEIVYLGMAVMTAGYAIIRTGFHDLVKFNFAIGTAFFSVT